MATEKPPTFWQQAWAYIRSLSWDDFKRMVRILVGILLLCAGFFLPYFTIQSYAKFLEAVDEHKWDRDTSYLQITNNYKLNIDTSCCGNTDEQKKSSPSYIGNSTNDVSNFYDRTFNESTLASNYKPKDTVNISKLEAQWHLKHKDDSDNLSQWRWIGIWSGGFIAITIILALFLTLVSLPPAAIREEDTDSEDLRGLYGEFKDKIQALEEPRKVIRLSNKVRVQYVLLKNLGLIIEGIRQTEVNDKGETTTTRINHPTGQIFMDSMFLLEDLHEESMKKGFTSGAPDIDNDNAFKAWLWTQTAFYLNSGNTTLFRPIDNEAIQNLIDEIYFMNKDLIFAKKTTPNTSSASGLIKN